MDRPRRSYTRYCEICERLLDAETNIEQPDAPVQPKPGDTSICVYCGTVYQYLEEFRTRRIPEEIFRDEFTPEQIRTIHQTQALCKALRARWEAESN